MKKLTERLQNRVVRGLLLAAACAALVATIIAAERLAKDINYALEQTVMTSPMPVY